ncbi:hypothetical protein M0802_011318 [Mischocyttarus mexicanus]|nr:hypothetical protein M0802_011318 [Mischocyttarus mexicanus]
MRISCTLNSNAAVNPCDYVDSEENSDAIIFIYVDDLLVASADLPREDEIKSLLKQKFELIDLEKLKDILEIHMDRDKDLEKIKIIQKEFFLDVLKKCTLTEYNPTLGKLLYVQLEKFSTLDSAGFFKASSI